VFQTEPALLYWETSFRHSDKKVEKFNAKKKRDRTGKALIVRKRTPKLHFERF
jgi:hypothetical protein